VPEETCAVFRNETAPETVVAAFRSGANVGVARQATEEIFGDVGSGRHLSNGLEMKAKTLFKSVKISVLYEAISEKLNREYGENDEDNIR